MKRLSPWNPLDHLRLLWWLLMEPQQLKAHREQYGEKAERSTGKWLVSTLTWLPFLLPFSAVGLEIIPFSLDSEPLTATYYLWASGGLFIPWFLTGVFGDRDEEDVGLAVKVTIVVAEGLAIVLTVGLAGGLAVVLGVGLVIVFAIVLGIILEVGVAVVLMGGLAVGLGAGLPVGRSVGRLVVLKIALGVALGIGLAVAVKESLKTGRASFLTRGAFGLLVAGNAFLVWYSYLGGWRVF